MIKTIRSTVSKMKAVVTGKVSVQSVTPQSIMSGVRSMMGLVGGKVVQKPTTFVLTNVKTSLPPSVPLASAYLTNNSSKISSNDVMRAPIENLQPYEKLTGISSDRPEIVLMSEFLPFYDIDVNSLGHGAVDASHMTPAARFFDAQAEVRELRAKNVVGLIEKLVEVDSKKADQVRGAFQNSMNDLYFSSVSLVDMLKRMEELKSKFDLRSPVHVVQTSHAASSVVASLSKILKTDTSKLTSGLSSRFSIQDILLDFGFSKNGVESIFPSTKLWMQLLLEFKRTITEHSVNLIDIDRSQYARDTSVSKIARTTSYRFNVNTDLQIFDVEKVLNIEASQVQSAIKSVMFGYKFLYSSNPAKTIEQRIAVLANHISREYRYSYGLFKQEAKNIAYDYGVTLNETGNQKIFDEIIGSFGSDIADIQDNDFISLASLGRGVKSIVDVSNGRRSNVGVFTFENRYVNTTNGTITPGSTYYVDSILKTSGFSFDTSHLNELIEQFDDIAKKFNNVVNTFNLFSFEAGTTDTNAKYADAAQLFDEILKKFVDLNKNIPYDVILNDPVAALFQRASTASGDVASTMKACLFLLVMSNIPTSKNIWNANVTDSMLNECLKAFSDSVTGISYASQNSEVRSMWPVSSEQIRNAVRDKTSPVFMGASTVMTSLMATFRDNSLCIVNGKLRYGGYSDTQLAMIIFDIVLAIVAQYGGQKVIAKSADTFYIQKRSELYSSSIVQVRTRLKKEDTSTTQCIYAIFNVVNNVRTLSQELINYFATPNVVARAAAIGSILDDEDVFRSLMSHQQIMMLGSTVKDFYARLMRASNHDVFSSDDDVNFTEKDVTSILDEGIVTTKLKKAIFGFLSQDDFATKSAFNKRILSVGIPNGFTEKLRTSVVNSSGVPNYENRQLDIIKVCIYKVDLRHQDVIYLPKKFMFEMSRFVVRDDEMLPDFTSVEDYIDNFPTRDYMQQFVSTSTNNDVQYLNSKVSGRAKAFDGSSYEFLSKKKRQELLKNHIVSFLMENYVKIMTGISIAEHDFHMVSREKSKLSDYAKALSDLNLKNTRSVSTVQQTKQTLGTFFSDTTVKPETTKTKAVKNDLAIVAKEPTKKSGILTAGGQSSKPNNVTSIGANSVISKPTKVRHVPVTPTKPDVTVTTEPEIVIKNTNVTIVSQKDMSKLLQQQATISEFSNMVTSYSDGLAVVKKLLSPKKFDRIFNILFDADEFQVDVTSTTKTKIGRDTLTSLLLSGELVKDKTRIFDREKTEGDITMDKFFVTIETVDRSDMFEAPQPDFVPQNTATPNFVQTAPQPPEQEPPPA